MSLISRKEIKWFTEDLENAVVKALDRDPPRTRGERCRWAPCKVNCPLWTGPMLELAKLEDIKRTEMVSREITDYGKYLAHAKTLVDIAAIYKKEVDEQLHAYLEDGGKRAGLAPQGQGQAAPMGRHGKGRRYAGGSRF